MRKTLFIRLLGFEDKSIGLRAAVDATRKGTTTEFLYERDPNGFRAIPSSPFAYAVGDGVRDVFQRLPPTQSDDVRVVEGLNTTDNERFLRLAWEAPIAQIGRGKRWVPMAKGGEHALFYSDIHLLVDWENNGKRMKDLVRTLYGSETKRIYGQGFYFRPGLTYSQRTQKGLSFRCLPRDSIFNVKGPGIFAEEELLPVLLGLVNSLAYRSLVELQTAFGSYNVGYLQRTPLPSLSGGEASRLGAISLTSFELARGLDTANETSHVFCLPALLQHSADTITARAAAWESRVEETRRALTRLQSEIDDISFGLYGITIEDRCALTELLTQKSSATASETGRDEEEEDSEDQSDITSQFSVIASLVSYAVGCIVGRWDLRFATGASPVPTLSRPFAALPVYAPGMLAKEARDLPLAIERDAILPDDPEHEGDIVRRVHDVFSLIWHELAESVEQEACAILGVKDLRDYFRKPAAGGYWANHISRYSKSRRKAPIYWLLQSARKNYGLWLYYHRFDSDTLSKALINYVEPKLRREENRLAELRSERASVGAVGSHARALDRKLEAQADFISELNDFQDKLRRAADLHLIPDLNDGVVLNVAPLWQLVPWKEAKNYWNELLEGKYEWSSISKQLKIKQVVAA